MRCDPYLQAAQNYSLRSVLQDLEWVGEGQRIKVLSTPRQAEPRFVPISDVTCSSGTSWQMWKISHYRGCRKPGEAFDLITSSYTNVFNVLFHFLKTHICFIYFQTKKIQPNNNNSKSTPIPSPSWEVPPRSPEYCSRLRPYFSTEVDLHTTGHLQRSRIERNRWNLDSDPQTILPVFRDTWVGRGGRLPVRNAPLLVSSALISGHLLHVGMS